MRRIVVPLLSLPALAIVVATPALALERGALSQVSVSDAEAQVAAASLAPAVNADGSLVAFASTSPDLVPDDTNGVADVFLRDRSAGTTQRVSVDSAGVQAGAASGNPSLSADGRYVVFSSSARLVAGDEDDLTDVYRHDRRTATTELVGLLPDGSAPGDPADVTSGVAVSADGSRIAFTVGRATQSNRRQAYLRDVTAGSSQLLSATQAGTPGNNSSFSAALSADGRTVAFESDASDLIADDTNGRLDIFARDLTTQVSQRVVPDSGGFRAPSISGDGRLVAVHQSERSPLGVYLADRAADTFRLVSTRRDGTPANGSARFAALSADGRVVAFAFTATNLVDDVTSPAQQNIYAVELATGDVEHLTDTGGRGQPNGASFRPVTSADATMVALSSNASNLIDGDTNRVQDVFARDLVPEQSAAPAPVIPEAPMAVLLVLVAVPVVAVLMRRAYRA